ncbi:MAG: DUF1565 domain-containing protein, partial [Planctomycetes bacterium]|nr:DUF1565 domain-containing protein [Planctomycetota bacterium]
MNSRIRIWIGLLAVTAILAQHGHSLAGEYFVDRGHPQCSDENAGTEALPWKTINKAVSVAQAGDTVWIKAGVYREGIQRFANRGEYYASRIRFITLAAYKNDRVVIDGTVVISESEWQRVEGTKNLFFISLPEDSNQV